MQLNVGPFGHWDATLRRLTAPGAVRDEIDTINVGCYSSADCEIGLGDCPMRFWLYRRSEIAVPVPLRNYSPKMSSEVRNATRFERNPLGWVALGPCHRADWHDLVGGSALAGHRTRSRPIFCTEMANRNNVVSLAPRCDGGLPVSGQVRRPQSLVRIYDAGYCHGNASGA